MKTHIAPIETVDHVECSAAPSAKRVYCGKCDKTFNACVVVNDSVLFDDAEQCWSVRRQFYCDHCDHLVSWFEAVSNNGQAPMFTGLVLSGPSYVRGRDRIENFLRRHPHAAGVLQH